MRPVWLFAFQATTSLLPSSTIPSRTRFVATVAIPPTGSVVARSMSSEPSAALAAAAAAPKSQKHLVVDPFCFRQFAEKDASRGYGGTVFQVSVERFEAVANSLYGDGIHTLQAGYAPFCKHLFVPARDFLPMPVTDDGDGDGDGDAASLPRVNVLPLEGNEHLVRSEYAARNDKEVPVLQRYIPLDALPGGVASLPPARYLDLILYSREQIRRENESMGTTTTPERTDGDNEEAPWGIVSIKAQLEDYELPMNPITQMRNALGKDQGGSGIPLDRDEYMKSVEYWSANVVVS